MFFLSQLRNVVGESFERGPDRVFDQFEVFVATARSRKACLDDAFRSRLILDGRPSGRTGAGEPLSVAPEDDVDELGRT